MTLSTSFKRQALVAVLGLATMMVSAQTFVSGGLIYKVSKTNVEVQEPGVKVTVGEDGPAEYAGDIVVPETVTYDGKTYTVKTIKSKAFKSQPKITSIDIQAKITSFGRGQFQGCEGLKTIKYPQTVTKFAGDVFSGCKSLTEFTINASVTSEVYKNMFRDCESLHKLVIEDSETPLDIDGGAFNKSETGNIAPLDEIVIGRPIGSKYTKVAEIPFRANPGVRKVTLRGGITEIPSNYFENCSNLAEVEIAGTVSVMGTSAFAGTGLVNVTLPEAITVIPASAFQGCKALNTMTIGSGVTSIADMAFYNSSVKSINLPATLKTIGQMAFSGAELSGVLTLPDAVTSIGAQAFAANTGITEVKMGPAIANIGSGAFSNCKSIAKYTVAADNTTYKSTDDNSAVISADGLTLLLYAVAHPATVLKGDYTEIMSNAANGAANLTEINLPACVTWGDYAVAGTSIKSFAVKGSIGRYVAANCPELTELTISGKEVPYGIAANDAKLAKVTFTDRITTVKQDAFLGCTALKELNLGTILAILEADAFKGCGVETMTVGAANPAGMAQGVFTAENSNITVKVPVEYVDAYKAAAGWSYLNIVGDANVVAGPSDMGMPAGMYYASPDGKLYCAYADGKTDSYDVGGVPHTFQLIEFKNRIYGASAGNKFVYSATGSVDGDGKLFYISKVGGETFQAVVLDNAGGNAYKDPFGLYIYGDILFVNDRNVCIRKISADAIALPMDYPSWVENNWLGFYGPHWTYGCIKSGWAITKGKNAQNEDEPVYWVGMKYNGNGIYRFRDGDIGDAGNPGAKPEKGVFLSGLNPIFTTFYIDEAHGHMYIYIEKAGSYNEDPAQSTYTKAGLYRIDMDKLEATPEPKSLDELGAILVDGSPVKYEGAGINEHVGISQLNPSADGKYLYWCYRAPSQSEADANEAQSYDDQSQGKYWWADKFDASNPLHQTGIKRLELGAAQPQVEMIVPGAEGYGVVDVNYEGSKQPDAVNTIVAPAEQAPVALVGDQLVASADAQVYVYNTAGLCVAYATLAAGQAMTVADLPAGAYIAVANGAALKFVK